MNLFLSCCNDSELLEELADKASIYGNHLILEQMQHKFQVLPLAYLLSHAIISDSHESVAVIHEMLTKNGKNVTWEMIQTAQKRGVTKIIETLTRVPYDAEREKENI